jgi:hypothetical protein
VISYALENCKDDIEFLDKRAAEEEATKKQIKEVIWDFGKTPIRNSKQL